MTTLGEKKLCVAVAVFAVSLFCYRPQTGSVCPSGGVSFSFVSERKSNQKEREFKGCALKNPPIVQSWYAQSIALCFPFLQLRVALCAMKLYEAGKGQKVGATIGRPPNSYQDNAERTGASPLRERGTASLKILPHQNLLSRLRRDTFPT